MEIVVKRAYDPPASADGYRVLVDRLWPRGVKKESLRLDEWCKAVAPSTELRTWFNHDPAKFEQFSNRYVTELAASEIPRQLLQRVGDRNVTLVYAAEDPQVNHAIVLAAYLKQLTEKSTTLQ